MNHINTTIECIKGDITRQDGIDAVVNAANANLMPGGGVAGAIHRSAGHELYEACKPFAPIKPGQAVITPAFNLPNRFVIHCLGPVFGMDKPEDVLLANCYKNSLLLADEYELASIAFPAISTGIFGYPVRSAAEVAFQAMKELLPALQHVKLIRMVLWDESDLRMHREVLGVVL